MLTCWQPGSFYACWGLSRKTTIKLYKCTIMLQWCLPAAGPGGLVKGGAVVVVGGGGSELMQQNIDKTPEGKAAAGWQESCTWEKFSFLQRGLLKKKKKRKASGNGSKRAVSISLQRERDQAGTLIQLCGGAIIVQSKCLLCLTWKIYKFNL